jgi:hypothetical protein
LKKPWLRFIPAALVALIALAAVAILWTGPAPPSQEPTLRDPGGGPEDHPYDPGAACNRPVPADAPRDPHSDAVVAELVRRVGGARIDASVDGEVPPVYVAAPGDPFYAIRVDGREERVRVPAGTEPGGGADYPLVILDRSHPDHGEFVEVRVWQARVDHVRRRISGNGVGLFHYNNDGRRLNPDGSRSLAVPFAGVGTGSGLSYLAGLVRPGEVAEGRIRHAIRVAWGCDGFTAATRAPAVRTDQAPGRCGPGPPDAARVDMGMRLRLDPAVDCTRRRAPTAVGR